MPETLRIIARFMNGAVLKGTSQDFHPDHPLFHLFNSEGGPALEIPCDQLKALYFVKTFDGDKQRQKLRGFAPSRFNQGKKIAVMFRDGELLCGYTMSYTPNRSGFFVFPTDTDGNNDRIYVFAAAVAEVGLGPAAETLATRVLGKS